MRKRSKKTAKLYRAERVPLVKRLLSEIFNCERCGGRSEVVHERLTRGRGGSITDPANCVVLCNACHAWVHDHPRQATEEGWLSNRWAALRSP